MSGGVFMLALQVVARTNGGATASSICASPIWAGYPLIFIEKWIVRHFVLPAPWRSDSKRYVLLMSFVMMGVL